MDREKAGTTVKRSPLSPPHLVPTPAPAWPTPSPLRTRHSTRPSDHVPWSSVVLWVVLGVVTPTWLALVMDLSFMDEALARLGGVDPCDRCDPESIETLMRLQSELCARVAESVAAFDAGGGWQATGARSATAWLVSTTGQRVKDAQTVLRRGRELRHLPRTGQAWLEGSITGAHVDVMISLRNPATVDALRRDEELLIAQARALPYAKFVRAVDYWRLLSDPDGSTDGAMARTTRRDAYLVKSYSGTWFGKLTLDPVSGAIVGNELEHLERQLFEAEWAEARERLGREPTVADLARTPGQRRADAFVVMAVRSATMPKDGQRPRPLFTTHVGYESMHGALSELEDGTVVPPTSLLSWLEGADVERAGFRPDGTVEVGATSRLKRRDVAGFDHAVFRAVTRVACPPTDRCFTGATRRAIEIRDRYCTHPECDLRASRCQIDHITPYSQGGPTVQANGRVLCGPHNRARNHSDDRIPAPKRE